MEVSAPPCPDPVWASSEEVGRVETTSVGKDAYWASWLSRSEPASRRAWSSLAIRGDILNDAYTVVEDAPEGWLTDESRRRILAVLTRERDQAWEAARRYKDEVYATAE